ncbi:unnamed protein product, partial [Mesorhabditis belari]|uniref:Dendritic cell-specific transmembrane protein-like domain-containing protein n=1 Tax=Mesorhabditis belari TaxID=2138241 RepID=A0AAF3FHJ0_9BILA
MLGSLLKLWWAKRRLGKALKRFQRYDEETFRVKFRRRFSKIYPRWRKNFEPRNFYDRIFVGGTKENNVLVAILHFALFQAFGIIFYFTFAFKLAQRPDRSGIYTGLTIGLFSGIALYFQDIMKIVVIIVWRLLAGKTRTLILFLIVSLSIEHNLGNLTENIQEVFEGTACAQEEFAKIRQKVAHKADDIFSMLENPDLIRTWKMIMSGFEVIGRKVRDGYRVLQNFADTTSRMFSSLNEVTEKCNRFFAGPTRKCMDVMHDLYETCHDWDPFNTGICHSTRHLFLLCDIGTHISDTFCRFPEHLKTWVIDGALGAMLEMAKVGVKKLSESKWYHWTIYVVDSVTNIPNIRLKLYLEQQDGSGVMVFAKQAKSQIRDNIHLEISLYITILRKTLTLLHYIMWFVLVIHIGISIKCILFYHTRNGSQNRYITKELQEIDRLQKLDGQGTIFPLVGEEKKKYMKLSSTRTTLWESTKRLFYMVITIIYGFVPLIFILIDAGIYALCSLIYWTMQNTKLHIPDHYEMKAVTDSHTSTLPITTSTPNITSPSPINSSSTWSTTPIDSTSSEAFSETTTSSLSQKDLGSMIANLFKELLDIFSPVHDAISGKDNAWRECFSEPSVPNYDLNWGLFIIWILSFVLAYWQVYLLRQWLQWARCFWPKRAHVHGLHLYNQILEERYRIPKSIAPKQTSILAKAQLNGHDALVRRGLHVQGKTVGQCTKCNRKKLHVRDKTNCHLCPGCGCFYCGDCHYFSSACMRCKAQFHKFQGITLHFEPDSDDFEETLENVVNISVTGTSATINIDTSSTGNEPEKALGVEKTQSDELPQQPQHDTPKEVLKTKS